MMERDKGRKKQTATCPPPLPGLYIHIPFCRSKCPYCDFYSTTTREHIPRFLPALMKEMFLYAADFPLVDTVYLGGGTPSLISGAELVRLWNELIKRFSLTALAEVTIEMNPGDGDLAYYKLLKEIGFNRVSLGVQSFNDQTLSFLGRRHNAREARLAIENAHKAGFDNIGIDLIYAVPGYNYPAWQETISLTQSLPVTHVSCYQLTIEQDTPLGRQVSNGEIRLPNEEEELNFFLQTSEYLEAKGFCHYEVSNFARGNKYKSRHNQKYWQHVRYLGLGPGAHSFDGRRRFWNNRSLADYLTGIESGGKPPGGCETLTLEELRTEAICLGLRTKQGICLKSFAGTYQMDLWAERQETIARLIRAGLLVVCDGSLRPTRQGLALADSLALI